MRVSKDEPEILSRKPLKVRDTISSNFERDSIAHFAVKNFLSGNLA
ncbi:15634_t:CDS:2 [Rhizophagus irregularis]|nr:15634_t:CDS:2 [Rhizophagus irregularis]